MRDETREVQAIAKLEVTVGHLEKAVQRLDLAIEKILSSNATKKDLEDATRVSTKLIVSRFRYIELIIITGVGAALMFLLQKIFDNVFS